MSDIAVITLTTDFGNSDGYAASVKGVILDINPGARIVDISHSVRPQEIFQASFLIKTVYSFFPEKTLHMVIVDPGVGSSRRAVILKTKKYYFIAPDNGVLTYVIGDADPLLVSRENLKPYSLQNTALPEYLEAYEINNLHYWRGDVSSTFHGRDIFGPVAAHLSRGVPLTDLGDQVDTLVTFNVPGLKRNHKGSISGQVIYVDTFGNLVTSFRKKDLPSGMFRARISGKTIEGLSGYYAVKPGLLALIGSSGYLEIAVSNGNAARELNAGFGDTVEVIPSDK